MAGLPSARFVAVVGVLSFWAGVFGAGLLVDAYSAREDYISSLAGRGSPVAVVGVGALLASAVAQLATSYAVFTRWRSRVCAFFLCGAGVAGATIASFRTSCPRGPAGCSRGEATTGDWIDAVHASSVGAYELFTLAAMLTLAIGAVRRGAPWPRWLGALSLVLAIGSVLLFGQTNGEDIGTWQRLWLADNLGWLLVVVLVATTAGTVPRHRGSSGDRDVTTPG